MKSNLEIFQQGFELRVGKEKWLDRHLMKAKVGGASAIWVWVCVFNLQLLQKEQSQRQRHDANSAGNFICLTTRLLLFFFYF